MKKRLERVGIPAHSINEVSLRTALVITQRDLFQPAKRFHPHTHQPPQADLDGRQVLPGRQRSLPGVEKNNAQTEQAQESGGSPSLSPTQQGGKWFSAQHIVHDEGERPGFEQASRRTQSEQSDGEGDAGCVRAIEPQHAQQAFHRRDCNDRERNGQAL